MIENNTTRTIIYEKFYKNMEDIRSDTEEKILENIANFDYKKYTKDDVKRVLSKSSFVLDDFKILLSPSAGFFLEEMAQRAYNETKKEFGNSISLFTPLYIANHCENECTYCGFKATNNTI